MLTVFTAPLGTCSKTFLVASTTKTICNAYHLAIAIGS